ncbi:hypothetical protein FPRO05_08360 [Fusarium proliferatum]|uniref:PNPLA domain-containing protein n=1 Tax=Gibberella intermedia TaxID=948311 RepID=A0A365NJG3_GIBIN|nr:hypothetical protein FPRO05_08360 [Fusarium proliferatum]
MATSSPDTSHTLQHQVSGESSADVDPSIPIRGPEHISYEVGPWAQKTILTFDGGGIRGYASLLVLKRIMTRIRELEYQHQDYRASDSSFYRWRGALEDNHLEDDPEPERFEQHHAGKIAEDRTRTIAISWAINKKTGVSKEWVWRSYDNDFGPKTNGTKRYNPSNAGPAHRTTIWEVARATTAAPGYFEAIKIMGRKFLDGGMVANNPSLIALREIHKLHSNLVPALFVSIGTGLKDPADAPNINNGVPNDVKGQSRTFKKATPRDDGRHKQFFKKYIEIGKNWKNWMMNCEGMNGTEGWLAHCEAIEMTEHLYRLNVGGDLHTVSLDDWRPWNTGEETLSFIKAQTDKYLAETPVINDINSIATKAVEIRRQRAATEHWERFAVDVVYRCSHCETKKYDTRAQLREHLQKGIEHTGYRMADGKHLEDTLNASRVFRTNRTEGRMA